MDSPRLQRLREILRIAKTQEGKKVFRCYFKALEKEGWKVWKYRPYTTGRWSVIVTRPENREHDETFYVADATELIPEIEKTIKWELDRLQRESDPKYHIHWVLSGPLRELGKNIKKLRESTVEAPIIRSAQNKALKRLERMYQTLEKYVNV